MAEPQPDEGVMRVLSRLGVSPDALLGFGGEAWVFADGAREVVRIHHAGFAESSVSGRAALLCELAGSAGRVPFGIPEVLDTQHIDGRIVTRERRLPGRPLLAVLAEATGASRGDLIVRYLDAASALGDLALERDAYGDLAREDPIETPTFRAYLERRAARSLRTAGPDFAGVSAAALAAAWPEPDAPSFVHLDAFPGNMLTEGGCISAVVDFGSVSLAGDRRLDPLTAAVYLTHEITPTATPDDRETAAAWLAEHRLDGLLGAARDWIAAHWSFATDDRRLHAWCRRVLL